MSAHQISSKLRLGGSTFSFMWQEPATRSLQRLRELELNDFDVILTPGHLWPDELTREKRTELEAWLRTEGIRIDSLNLPALDFNLASAIPAVRAMSVAIYEEVLALADDLGIRNVVVVPGRVSGLLPPALAASVDWLGESMQRLLAVAARHDQRIYLESHPLTPIPTAALINDFLDRMRDPRLLVAYDVANAEFIGEDQPAALRKLKGRVGQIHLSDATRTSWRHDRIGAGTVNFPAVLAALERIGFAGISILEIISGDPVRDTADSIKEIGNPAD